MRHTVPHLDDGGGDDDDDDDEEEEICFVWYVHRVSLYDHRRPVEGCHSTNSRFFVQINIPIMDDDDLDDDNGGGGGR